MKAYTNTNLNASMKMNTLINILKHYLSVSGYLIKMEIQSQLEYPSFLVCWAIGIPIQYISGVWMIGVITERFQSLNGWDFPHITFLYGLSLLSQAIMVVLFIQTWHIEGMVIHGEFDRLLLRPLNVFYQFCVQYFNFIGFLDMLPGIIIFLYGCSAVGFVWTFSNTIKLILVICGAVLIRAAFFTTIGCISFWTKGSRSLVRTGEVLLERTTMYPLSIYPYAIQVIFTFILPFGFISFYPASEFLKQTEHLVIPLDFALITPIVGIITAYIALLVFTTGLKKYESAGS